MSEKAPDLRRLRFGTRLVLMKNIDKVCQAAHLCTEMRSISTTLNISLPKPLKKFVEEQTVSGGYTSASEDLRELIRAARRLRTRNHQLETLLLEGLESGPCIEADEDYWVAKERGLLDRWGDLGKK